jgi:hypothetical protein
MKPGHNRLCGSIPLAVIAFTLLSIPTIAMAETEQQKTQKHVTTTYAKKHAATRKQQPYEQRNLYGWDQHPAGGGCGYQNAYPPCQSTWPQGSPSYHGPVAGPTFFDEH